MLPLAVLEWNVAARPVWTPSATVGTIYLGLVMTALGYAIWNWCLERVETPRVAIFAPCSACGGSGSGSPSSRSRAAS